jgi:hypothetical protein
LAQAALEKYQGYKSFKIERSRAKISYCHPGVFVPVYSDEGNFSFKTSNGATVAYWDEFGYASEWVQPSKEGTKSNYYPNNSRPRRTINTILHRSQSLGNSTCHSRDNHLWYTPISALLIAEPVIHPEVDKKRELWGQLDQQKKKRKIESIALSKTPAAQLEKWTSKRQELNENKSISPDTQVSEFADLKQMCCLLCKRKFQSIAEIQKHERMSNLHKVFHFLF